MSRPERGKASAVQFGVEPRAQLLPSSVREREQVRAARRLTVMLVVGAVAVAGALGGLAGLRLFQSQVELASAQAETQAILTEQSKYGEAKRISSTLAEIKQAQTASTSLEILWAPVLRQISGAVPGASLTSIDVTSQAPWEPALTPAGPLRTPHVAELTLIYSSPGPLNAVALTTALSALPGYADSVVQSMSSQNGAFTTTVSLTLSTGALSQRYATPSSPNPSPSPTSPVASAEGAAR